MPFPEINIQNKTFFSLSSNAESIIQEDMHTFGCNSFGVFTNTIIENFWEIAESSVSFRLQSARKSYERILQNCSLDAKMKKEVIDALMESEKKNAQESIELCKKDKTDLRHVIYLNKANAEILFEICDEQEIYKDRVSLYIKCLLEEYATLPYIQREQIYYKKTFEDINRACSENRLIRVYPPKDQKGENAKIEDRKSNNKKNKDKEIKDQKNKKKESYIEVYPYRILTDSMNTRSYLACYGKTEKDTSPKIASFRISNLKNYRVTSQDGSLTNKETDDIEAAIQKRGVGFLIGEPTEIQVRLTDAGKRLYETKLFSRPQYNYVRSEENTYVFSCTEQQAFVYFHPFGKDAEILSPPSLRERMIQSYKDGLKQYKK